MAEWSEARLWRWSPGRTDKRLAGAVGRDEAMQAGCQPPSRVCQAVISVHTRTLGPTRCELVRSALLIASPTAPAWGNMASQAPLHEATGMGALGFSHPGAAPQLAQAPVVMAPLLADGLGVPHGEHCAWLTSRRARSSNPTPDLPGTLASTHADVRHSHCRGMPGSAIYSPPPLPTRNVGTAAPLTSWGRAGGTLGFAIHTGTPAPSPAVGQGAGGPVYATQARSVAQNAGTPAALPRPSGEAPSGQGRPPTPARRGSPTRGGVPRATGEPMGSGGGEYQ